MSEEKRLIGWREVGKLNKNDRTSLDYSIPAGIKTFVELVEVRRQYGDSMIVIMDGDYLKVPEWAIWTS